MHFHLCNLIFHQRFSPEIDLQFHLFYNVCVSARGQMVLFIKENNNKNVYLRWSDSPSLILLNQVRSMIRHQVQENQGQDNQGQDNQGQDNQRKIKKHIPQMFLLKY